MVGLDAPGGVIPLPHVPHVPRGWMLRGAWRRWKPWGPRKAGREGERQRRKRRQIGQELPLEKVGHRGSECNRAQGNGLRSDTLNDKNGQTKRA